MFVFVFFDKGFNCDVVFYVFWVFFGYVISCVVIKGGFCGIVIVGKSFGWN